MKPVWDDLNARARGLGTRFLTRGQLEALARAPDSAALTRGFRRLRLPVAGERESATPAELELAVRRWAADALDILARWAGPRVAALAVIYEEEDRCSLRALLRGAVRGVPPEARLSGLLPTPALPERALEELAHQVSPFAVATLLVAWQHPYGAALLPAASAVQPNVLGLELALSRTLAARALAAAQRAGGGALLGFVKETVDLANAVTALVLAVEGKDVVPKQAFVAGGERISITVFEEAAALGAAGAAGLRIAAALAPAAVATAFQRQAREPAALEEELLRIRIRELGRRMRRSPLGPIPVLWFGLRLRAQVADLQRIVWGAALSAPRAGIAAALVTAP